MGKRCAQTFHPKAYADGEQAHEKMFNIIRHQGNENQNQTRYYYTLNRMTKMKNNDNIKSGEDLQKLGCTNLWWVLPVVGESRNSTEFWEKVWPVL